MKRILPLLTFLSVAVGAHAQTIILKDGKNIVGSRLRRDGASVMTTVLVGNAPGEIGYAVAQIASIEFPDPPQLKDASTLIAAGKLDQALTVIEPVINFYRSYRDIKGNFWGEAAVMKLSIFMAQKREKDASGLIYEIQTTNQDADVVGAANASKALLLAWAGQWKEAIAASDPIINNEDSSSTALSLAYLASGESHYALKEYEDAAFSYLHIPIFFPEEKLMMPKALLGSARCFAKLDVRNELESSISTLKESFPTSPEFADAKTEFPSIISHLKTINR